MKIHLTMCATAAIVLAAAFAYPAVLVVDPDGGGDFLTLEAAVLEAVDGDVLELVDGTHYVSASPLVIQVSLTLRSASENASSCTIAGDGENASGLVDDGSGIELEIQGISFSDFHISLFCNYQVQGCQFHFSNDLGLTEGGIWLLGANGTFENSTIDQILVWVQGNENTFRSCQFTDSEIRSMTWAGEMGTGDYYIEDCSFTGFSKIYLREAYSVAVDRCTFSGNEVLGGSLLDATPGQNLSITSCLFSDNQLGTGCALQVLPGFHPGSEVTVENCTFRNNNSMGQTVGIFCGPSWPGMWLNVSCENLDFVGNVAPNGFPDCYVEDESSINFNCCEIDEANIGGPGQATVTFDGCSVATSKLGLGDLKALYR